MKHNRRLPRLCQRTSPSSGKTLAYATFNGRTVSFGPYGPGAQREFDAFLAAWLAAGRRMPDEGPEENPFTVGQLIDAYLDHLRHRHPEPWLANNYARIELATRPLRELFEAAAAREFSPKKLASVRQHMIEGESLCRREINERVRILRKMFKWACAEELVTGEQAHALAAVDPLRRGDYGTHEGRKVLPVSRETVDATLPHLSRPVRAIVELLWCCGARPSEVLRLRPCDIHRDREKWVVPLEHHKNAAKGKIRVLFMGPEAQAVLRPFLLNRRSEVFLFSPREAVAEMERRKRQDRKTPMYRSHAARYRRERAQRSRREVGDHYTSQALARAIERAVAAENRRRRVLAKKNGDDEWVEVDHWTPYQLRHAVAQRISKRYGIGGVRSVFGHSSCSTSLLYLQPDEELAQRIMSEVG